MANKPFRKLTRRELRANANEYSNNVMNSRSQFFQKFVLIFLASIIFGAATFQNGSIFDGKLAIHNCPTKEDQENHTAKKTKANATSMNWLSIEKG